MKVTTISTQQHQAAIFQSTHGRTGNEQHTRYRSLVSKLFRVSEINKSEEQVRAVIERSVDLQKLLVRLIEARREDPRKDMITILANSTFGWGMLILCGNPDLQGIPNRKPSRA